MLKDADPIPRWTVPPVEYDTDQSPEWYGMRGAWFGTLILAAILITAVLAGAQALGLI